MSNTITISVTAQDLQALKENPSWSASKIFRSAMRMQRSMEEFFNIYDIWDFVLELRGSKEKFMTLQKEIERRNERIDSLQDVLAQKELAERRVRKAQQTDNGLETGIHTPQIGV